MPFAYNTRNYCRVVPTRAVLPPQLLFCTNCHLSMQCHLIIIGDNSERPHTRTSRTPHSRFGITPVHARRWLLIGVSRECQLQSVC